MPLFSRKHHSASNPTQPGAGPMHPQDTNKRFKITMPRLFRSSHHHDTTTQVPGVDTTALEIGQVIPVGHEQHMSVANLNDIQTPHHDLSDPIKIQAEDHNPYPNSVDHAAVPAATQLECAQDLTISGNPILTNIGMNTGVHNVTTHSTVNNYGGTYGLENLTEFISFAALHDSAEQDPTCRCHPGTRKNVLSQLRHWIDNLNPTDRICWLYGPTGAGKSAIAQTIAHAYEDGQVAATFFFYRSDPGRNDGNRLFPTIAWQLAFSIPTIKDSIVHVLDRTPHLPRKDIETQFKQLVVYPFHSANNIMSHLAPVVIIDGLDECSDEQLQRRILSVIGNAIKDCSIPLRFLICSRPEALIEEALNQFKDITLRIDLATLDDCNCDIEKYLLDQFSDIRSKCDLAPTWPGPEVIEEFVFKSSGNFIFAATVMRYISDEDCDPEEQLDIVRNLKPCGKMSPFALLDELYLETLKRQRDQGFLKTFLGLFVGRSSDKASNLHKDDAMLMNVSEKNLHTKLRRMRSLFKFEPCIDVHHKSFLDFLQDSSRSGQYHVSKQDGQKRYLELIVDCIVGHISTAIEQPNTHDQCCSKPTFRSSVDSYPPRIGLPIEDWQAVLKPLLDLQNRLLKTSKPQPCGMYRAMRDLLQLMDVLGKFHHMAIARDLNSNVNETVATWCPSLVMEIEDNMHKKDLDTYLSALLSCLPMSESVSTVNTVIIERISSLLAFDHVAVAARIRSMGDAQKLIDLVALLFSNRFFLSPDRCDQDLARKAAVLVFEIYARVPLLPWSVFLKGSTQQCDWILEVKSGTLEYECSSVFISRILDHNFVLPAWLTFHEDHDSYKLVHGNINESNESVDNWLIRSSPNFVARIRVMLGIARAIQYIHSMNDFIALNSYWIQSKYITLDSNLHAKIMFRGYFAEEMSDRKEDLDDFTHESNINAFGKLFKSIRFVGSEGKGPKHLVEHARNLIQWCCAKNPKSRPTMDEVIREMAAWKIT